MERRRESASNSAVSDKSHPTDTTATDISDFEFILSSFLTPTPSSTRPLPPGSSVTRDSGADVVLGYVVEVEVSKLRKPVDRVRSAAPAEATSSQVVVIEEGALGRTNGVVVGVGEVGQGGSVQSAEEAVHQAELEDKQVIGGESLVEGDRAAAALSPFPVGGEEEREERTEAEIWNRMAKVPLQGEAGDAGASHALTSVGSSGQPVGLITVSSADVDLTGDTVACGVGDSVEERNEQVVRDVSRAGGELGNTAAVAIPDTAAINSQVAAGLPVEASDKSSIISPCHAPSPGDTGLELDDR